MNGRQLAGGNSTSKKADNDFYTTNPKTVKLFLEKFIQDGNKLYGDIWECAWGMYNAVADFVSNTTPFRNTATYKENKMNQFCSGYAMLTTAQDLLIVA